MRGDTLHPPIGQARTPNRDAVNAVNAAYDFEQRNIRPHPWHFLEPTQCDVGSDERLAREALASQVKFDKLAHWRLADHLYLCTAGGLLKAHEVPARWGWLEVTRGALRLRRPAPPLASPEPRRWRTVRNIHRAETRA